jgi:hypothetical protein
MNRRLDYGRYFVVSVALAACVAGHAAVDALTTLHLPTTGSYAAYHHVAVAPTALLGIAIALVAFVKRASHVGGTSARARSSWLLRGADSLKQRAPGTTFAGIFGVQISALFVMETIEHLATTGTLCQGFEWLGAAPFAALAIHASVAAIATVLLRASVRAILLGWDALVASIATLLVVLLDVGAPATLYRALGRTRPQLTPTAPSANRRALRAPPTSILVA